MRKHDVFSSAKSVTGFKMDEEVVEESFQDDRKVKTPHMLTRTEQTELTYRTTADRKQMGHTNMEYFIKYYRSTFKKVSMKSVHIQYQDQLYSHTVRLYIHANTVEDTVLYKVVKSYN